jgi:hypothetical protein
MMTEENLLSELCRPFHPSAIEWKPGATNREKTSALGLAYADVRAYMRRLDEVCGVGWGVTYRPWGDKIICDLTIVGVTRSSTGEPDSQSEKSEIAGTAAEAQAFKRACAMWGLGRYLYDLPAVWADYDGERRQFTAQGKAKLDGVVAQHYKRSLTVDKATGEITGQSDAPSAAEDEWNGIPAVSDGDGKPTVPAALRKKFHGLGVELYQDGWDTKRRELVKAVTTGQAESSNDLTEAEMKRLITGMEKVRSERQPANGTAA